MNKSLDDKKRYQKEYRIKNRERARQLRLAKKVEQAAYSREWYLKKKAEREQIIYKIKADIEKKREANANRPKYYAIVGDDIYGPFLGKDKAFLVAKGKTKPRQSMLIEKEFK